MKPINLLPKAPYLVKRRDFFILLALIAAGTFLIAQLSLAYVWKANRSSDEVSLQQITSRVQELQRRTTLDPQSQLYRQGEEMLKQLTDARPDWIPVLDSLFAALPYQGQMDQLSVTDGRVLSLTAIVLGEAQLNDTIRQLEAVPYFDRMSLTVTEHKQFRSGDKARLLFKDGQTLDLTNREYYTLSIDIPLPSVVDIRKGEEP
ncbi:PilN domain-containing protein [Gorillibacterium sp. sgz500922]|uniref:PilN domain-containing protein n=1 Tax=Gorillibacterium sp. sgz500922 TaxID=3446694 RepID=UPI003F668A5E